MDDFHWVKLIFTGDKTNEVSCYARKLVCPQRINWMNLGKAPFSSLKQRNGRLLWEYRIKRECCEHSAAGNTPLRYVLRLHVPVGCKPYRGEPSRPPGTAHILALGGSYVRQLLGLTANPPCTQHRATHNGGKVLEMKSVGKKSAQSAKSQASPISSFCCLRCIFESRPERVDGKIPHCV